MSITKIVMASPRNWTEGGIQKWGVRRPGLVVIYMLTLVLSIEGFAQTTAENDQLLRQEMAYHTGVLAYIYGYPLVHMQQRMHNDTHRVDPNQSRYAAVNRFYQSEALATPETAGTLRAPNSDTLYFAGWFDLRKEPVILHNPDTLGRYFTMAVTNQWAEVIHLGRRTTGTKEQYHALVGPGWEGELPADVTAVEMDTFIVWVLGRLLVDGKEDEAASLIMQNQFWASPLNTWNRGRPLPKASEKSGVAMNVLGSLDYFAVMNSALRSNPRRPDEAALMSQFNDIGIGPDEVFQKDNLDPDTKAGLERAIVDARKLIRASTARTIPQVNRWMISRKIGRYGHDYLQRAATVAGGYGNLPEESLYAATLFDQHSGMLQGSKRYRIHFAADQLPPVDGFWSFSVYRVEDSNWEKNSMQRYGLGDRTAGLQYGEDGSLILQIQHEEPDEGLSNWLPAPQGGFYIILRLYEPQDALLDGSYEIPPVEITD
ncbi:MAG: hypothetical protein ACI9GW_003098 [Halieaceae bacterium]|jgi:hypothetical protein